MSRYAGSNHCCVPTAKGNGGLPSMDWEELGNIHVRETRCRVLELIRLNSSRKTTIAIEFCHRRQKSQPGDHIFWVHGDSHEAFNNSYLEMGREAGILGDDAHDDKALQCVKTWLDRSASGNWIMIIDNFDEVASYPTKYLPVKRGTILYTTRDGSLLGNLVPPNAGVEIPAMSNAEALVTFSKLLAVDEDAAPVHSDNVLELLGELEYLPLAIAQAAAFIRQTREEIPAYLKMFRACERNQQELLSKALPSAIGDYKGPGSRAVMTTWKLTIGKIQEKSPASVQLLEVMCFLSPDDIQKALLRGVPYFKNGSDVQFAEAFAPLLNFSLIYKLHTSGYRLHRLVALCVRTEMDSDGLHRRSELLETLFALLSDSFPEDMSGNLIQCSHLAAHAAVALGHNVNGYHPGLGSRLRLLQLLGEFLTNNGDYGGALVWYQQALDSYEKALGKDHLDTLGIVNDMATAFRKQGDYNKALAWYQRALDGREKVLGEEQPETLNTVSNMAIVFDRQGDYGKALVWYQRAIEGKEKALGVDHLNTLTTVNNMANTFRKQGDYNKALVWYQRVIDSREKVLGVDHPDTLITVSKMANVFALQGDYGKALVWYQRAIDGYEKALGSEHPDTVKTVNNMAVVFDLQGDYDKALVWYQRALDGYEKALGVDHPGTLIIVNNMAIVFMQQGDYGKALVWYQRAIDGCEKVLGVDHPNTLSVVHNMANTFWKQGDYGKALVWYQRALDGREEALGVNHPDTLSTVDSMASNFRKQGDYNKALVWYQRAIDGYEKALGLDHPDTVKTVNNMAVVFDLQGDYDKALVWYQRALDGYEKALGVDHPDTLITVSNMAIVFGLQGDHGKALVWYQRVLDSREKALGKEHPETLGAARTVSNARRLAGRRRVDFWRWTRSA